MSAAMNSVPGALVGRERVLEGGVILVLQVDERSTSKYLHKKYIWG